MTRRLFFALQPDPGQADSLIARVTPLALTLRGQPVPSGNVHATLTFIGAVPEDRMGALRDMAVSVRGTPGQIVFDTLEIWEEPRILAATAPGQRTTEASELAAALRDAAISAGFAPDNKPFRPHLTLARKIDLAEAGKHSWPRECLPGFVVRFERFALMESRRGERGSLYSVVETWPLYRNAAS